MPRTLPGSLLRSAHRGALSKPVRPGKSTQHRGGNALLQQSRQSGDADIDRRHLLDHPVVGGVDEDAGEPAAAIPTIDVIPLLTSAWSTGAETLTCVCTVPLARPCPAERLALGDRGGGQRGDIHIRG